MPTTNVTAGSFTVFEDESYDGDPAFNWENVASNLVNYGEITSTYAAVDCWNADGLLDNRGLVHVNGPGTAYGLYSPNWAPFVLNAGTWLIQGTAAYGMMTWGASPYQDVPDLTNEGDWIVEGVNSAVGVYLNNGGEVVNSGDLIVSASNGQAIGIYMNLWGSIENTGLIEVTGLSSVGLAVAELYGGAEPNIFNSGTITAEIAILGYANGGITPWFNILNTGTINGIIDLYVASDILDNQGHINGDVFTYFGDDLVDTTQGVISGVVYLEDGNDEFRGGAQGQIVVAGIGNDLLTGGDGGDEFYGENGADTISGGGGGDYLSGGSAPDTLSGGDGDDIIDGGTGTDAIDGGAGFDLASYDTAIAAVTVSLLLQGAAQETGGGGLDTLIGIEDLAGSAHNDVLTGDANGNYLFGLAGEDVLNGGAGADVLIGGVGADTVNGGGGVDVVLADLASTEASWTRNIDGTWTITAGAEGTDTLTNVEFLSFTDRDVFLDRAQRTFSGNGTSDILFRRADGIMASWEVSGSTIDAASFLPTAGAEWSALGTGDFNGDGRDDVLWQRNDGLVYSWTMNGGAVSAAVGLAGLGAEWSFLGVGDFNGDLVDDLAWRRNDGIVYTWTMQNTAIQSANNVTGLGAEWQAAGFGDFNGDGRDDFLWRNTNTGQSVVWHMNGSTIQSPGPTSEQASLDWAVLGVGDTNGDGRDDVILQRASDGMIAVWAMDGMTVMSNTEVAAANPADWTVRGIGDYNGDGRDDILWQNDSGLVYVWLMNGASIQSAGALSGIGAEWGII